MSDLHKITRAPLAIPATDRTGRAAMASHGGRELLAPEPSSANPVAMTLPEVTAPNVVAPPSLLDGARSFAAQLANMGFGGLLDSDQLTAEFLKLASLDLSTHQDIEAMLNEARSLMRKVAFQLEQRAREQAEATAFARPAAARAESALAAQGDAVRAEARSSEAQEGVAQRNAVRQRELMEQLITALARMRPDHEALDEAWLDAAKSARDAARSLEEAIDANVAVQAGLKKGRAG